MFNFLLSIFGSFLPVLIFMFDCCIRKNVVTLSLDDNFPDQKTLTSAPRLLMWTSTSNILL